MRKEHEQTFRGDRMRRLRTEQGWTITSLAREIGVSRQQVGAWENEQYEPGLANLAAIAEALSVSTDYLLDLESDET